MTDHSPLLTWERMTLQLRNPFRLSYGVTDTRHSFWIRLAEDEGWGEAAIPPYYGISDEAMIAVWEAATRRGDPLPEQSDDVANWIGTDGAAPGRAALDLALHDRIARRLGLPLYLALGLPPPADLPTAYTIAIADPDETARLAAAMPAFSILKLKLGSPDDVARAAAVRTVRPNVRLCVDANAGWTAEDAVARVRALERFNLELVEQPVAKHDIAGMGYVQAHTDRPVVADESVQSLADVEALAAAGVQGINLKLQKVGGLGPGLRILRRARELGLRVLLGCMIETSLGTTAMAHLAGLAEWLDLDAPLLIANDPFEGVRYDGLTGVAPGEIRYLRIWEQVPRPWAAHRFWPDDATLGQNAVISMYAHIYVKILHGIVPVEADGSAHFVVPADRNLFFQVLDKDFLEIQRMRTFVNLRPGESRSCIGCHEPRNQTPSRRVPLALLRPADLPGPQPGETVPRSLYYPTDIQPILDQHCVRCHGGEKTEGGVVLTGELTTYFNRSYETLMAGKWITYIQEFVGPQPRAQKTNVTPLPPKSLGSHASRLVGLLRAGHYDAALSPEQWVRLVTWVDANGPYYGSYFGRRNLKYQGLPDFRPLASLEEVLRPRSPQAANEAAASSPSP